MEHSHHLATVLTHTSLRPEDQHALLDLFSNPEHATLCAQTIEQCGAPFAAYLLTNYEQKRAVFAMRDERFFEVVLADELHDLLTFADTAHHA